MIPVYLTATSLETLERRPSEVLSEDRSVALARHTQEILPNTNYQTKSIPTEISLLLVE